MKKSLKTSTALILAFAVLFGAAIIAAPAGALSGPAYKMRSSLAMTAEKKAEISRLVEAASDRDGETMLRQSERAREKAAKYAGGKDERPSAENGSVSGPSKADIIASGKCGDKLTWTFDSNGTFTVKGTGDMYDYWEDYNEDDEYCVTTPWYEYATEINKVVIKDGVTSIGDYAFYDCYYLSSVTLPSGLKTIGVSAFDFCFALCSVNIPSSVIDIYYRAFANTRLETVTIPANVEYIGAGAFSTIGTTAEFKVSSNNKNYKAKNGVLFEKDEWRLVAYPSARQGSYSIPSTVVSIGDYAFAHCEGLTAVGIPNSVYFIGEYAFYECSGLSSVNVKDSSHDVYIGMYAFAWCIGITNAKLGAGVTLIHAYAFYDNEALKTLTLPGSVTHIGSAAFHFCDKLSTVYFRGSESLWDSVYISDCNDPVLDAKVRFASSTPAAPTGFAIKNVNYSTVKLTWKKTSGAEGYVVYIAYEENGPFYFDVITTSTSVNRGGLQVGGTYYYKVQAYGTIDGNIIYSDYSSTAVARPVPAAPETFTAVSAGYNSVKLTWSKVTGSSGYIVYYSTSKNGTYTTLKTITSGSTLTWKHTKLKCGKTYYYKVRAYRKNYEDKKIGGKYSEIASAKPIPGTVTLTLTQAGSNSVDLSWTSVSGATGYQVFRSTAKNGDYTLVKGTTKTSYTDTGLKKGKTYYYKVRAYRTEDGKKVYGNYKLKSIKLS